MRKGQALVVVLLALAIAMTVGLAIVTRNVTEVGISTTQEESARALSAAESGIEAALGGVVVGGVGSGNVGSQGATYDVKTVDVGGGRYVTFPEGLMAGESTTLFLTDYNKDGTLKLPLSGTFAGRLDICWGDPNLSGETPGIEAELYYYNSAYVIKRLAFDPSGRGGFSSAGVSAPGGSDNCPGDRPYKYKVSFDPLATSFGLAAGDKPVFMRLRTWYNPNESHYLAAGANSGNILPVQGVLVEATGKAGETARKVQAFRRYPDMADLIDFTVFSGGDLLK
ncbi:MAG: hypothetical protein Q7S31_00550 [bacterium]|nr:hypothetical protein [bacterium]